VGRHAYDEAQGVAMPSNEHEIPLQLVDDKLELLPELIRRTLALQLPPYKELRREKSELGELSPTDRRADLVLTLRDGNIVKAGIILEVQLKPDNRKKYNGPAYAASLHAELNLARFDPKTNEEAGDPIPVYLVILTFSEATASWAQDPIKTLMPNAPLRFLVIGPSLIPRIEKSDEAKKSPELALLSAMAHARRPKDISVVAATYEAISSLADPERVNIYLDYLAAVLSDGLKTHLEKLMNIDPNTFEFRSTTFRKLFQDKMDIEVKKEVQKELQKEVQKETAKERLAIKREDILALLSLRKITHKTTDRQKIEACDNLALLNTWFATQRRQRPFRRSSSLHFQQPQAKPKNRRSNPATGFAVLLSVA
jgi:hypothetical protein